MPLPVNAPRLVSITAVTAAALSIVTLAWLTWIVVNPGFWFPGAYAESGQDENGEPFYLYGRPGSAEGVSSELLDEVRSELDGVRSGVDEVRSEVESVDGRVGELESEEHVDLDEFSELERKIEDACSYVLEARGWGC